MQKTVEMSYSAIKIKCPLWAFYFYLRWLDENPGVRAVGERGPWSDNEHGNIQSRTRRHKN